MALRQLKKCRMKFSKKEIKDLVKAWIIISLIFTIGFGAKELALKSLIIFAMAAFTVGLGFLLHELAHKFVAQRFKCWAEFRSFDQMLGIALLLSFFGFIFAAPGAVMIRGRVDSRKNGLISVAGPIINIILGIIFIIISFSSNKIISMIASYGAEINLFLAIFNMIPFFVLDGAKVWKWNKIVYFITIGVAGLLLFARNKILSL